MHDEIAILAVTATSVGFLHALLGPDHYVPFIVMARSGRWSLAKTLRVTAACGLGHLLASAALGGLGVGLGWTAGRVAWLEALRGHMAGWLLIGFGLAYCAWGLRQAARRRPHAHWHAHGDGTVHRHVHTHTGEHAHVHASPAGSDGNRGVAAMRMTPWLLFTLFVLGPCEPLIPLLMYPAATSNLAGVVVVALVFGVATLVTMLGITAAGYLGLSSLAFGPLERFTHAAAALMIIACGVAIELGL